MRFCISILLLLASLHLSAGGSFVRSTSGGIELHNNKVTMLISEDAELISCKENNTGVDIAAGGRHSIASASSIKGSSVEAKKIKLNGSTLLVYFGEVVVSLEIQAKEDYFTFEVIGDYSKTFDSITFIDLTFNYGFDDSNPLVAAGVAMSIQTDPVFFPSGESRRLSGRCTAHTGMKGAKLAAVICRKEDLRDILKTIYSSLQDYTVPVTSVGGPFALDNAINRTDCLIISDTNPSNVQEWIDFYSKFGIRQFDFITGSKTFIQGDFSFPLLGTAAVFNEKIASPLKKAGIFPTLHTYSYYIGYQAKELLSNPKWQQQLEFRGSFTLLNKISATQGEFEVRGDLNKLKTDPASRSVLSPYLLIDNEIVKYSLDNKGRLMCLRGQCGTTAVEHKAGATVRIIGGYYSHIAPQPGSELFYEVARRTAEAYNDGGFGGFYFDALDGLSVHLKYAGLGDYVWYYGALFINEVLKNCNEPPLVEYSTLYPSLWAARGRGGALDFPNRGYKNFIDDHNQYNKSLIDRQYVTTLGWLNFYPVNSKEPHNYSTKYLFFDDVDYIGAKAIAYDQTMVYNGLKVSDVDASPAMRRNLERYSEYNRVRTTGYFNDSVISELREGKHEYKLAKKSGRWGFYEAEYSRCKLRDISLNVLSGVNPFKRQKPFVRLENLYTSDCRSSIPLLNFNEQVDISNQNCEKRFASPIDLSQHLGIKVLIKGNGVESNDAICIRLSSLAPVTGCGDYYVPLNFEGWRDIILIDLDNAEFSYKDFPGMDDLNYTVHRYDVDFSSIRSIRVFKSGECKEVRIKQIEAVTLQSNPLVNPAIHLGKASVVFNDTIQSGEYIEYTVGNKQAIVYDYLGNGRTIGVSGAGRFRVPKGKFSVSVSEESKLIDVPSGVVLTIGLYGKFIHN